MKVCVLGSGQMGTGIASLLIQSSITGEVIWWGRSRASLDGSYIRVKKEIRRFARSSKFTQDELLKKLKITNDMSDVNGSSFCIEAVKEEFATKKDILSLASEYLDNECVIATNTSSLSITALSMCVKAPENVLGMHFFNPTSMMALVEIVKGLNTSKNALEKAALLAESVGKSTVDVNESPGFIVNRMLIPMINEAISVYAEGVASIEDIDNAMKLGANHPLGPISLADLIGTDVCLSIMETLHYETGDPKYRAHPLLRQYVRAGFLGRKTKKGFYDYR